MKKKISYRLCRLLSALLVCCWCSGTYAQKISVERMNSGQPLISKNTFVQAGYPESDADNINGPCLVKLPDWLPRSQRVSPKANYYGSV